MTDAETSPTRLDRFAVIAVLTLFAVTWPVLDLLGSNAEFFLARRSPKTEILALAVIATLLIPALLGLLGILPGRAGAILSLAVTVVLFAALAFLYTRRLPVPWWVALSVSILLGGIGAWSFRSFSRLRVAGNYLLAAPLVLLAVFLFAMPVGDVLREPNTSVGNPVSVETPAPIVMIVFDEFPLASIIDPEGNLRSDRYPNFARLGADSIWYRNAVTIEQQTEHSVPAILTGSRPDHDDVPVTGHYPFNLFTALRDSYQLHVYESITQLCPRELCEGLTNTVSSLADDVAVVAGHVLLPEPLTGGLPPVDRAWGDFDLVANDFDAKSQFREQLEIGPREPIDDLLDDIRSAPHLEPELFYLHALVPHHPWQFLPDGRTYPYVVGLNPASIDGGWSDDEFLVAQSMQRHLLQVGYADRVLGEVLTALQDEGIYDESLVVVVADHGIAIRPGVEHQRKITDDSVGEIAAIPLFVKPPGAAGGVIDDRRALTIDILPTIADVIDADLPDDVQGVSLLGPAPPREETTTLGPASSATYGVSGTEKLAVAARIEKLFPDGDPWALTPGGSRALLGTAVGEAGLEASGLGVRLREPDLFSEVDISSSVIPSRIGGVLYGDVAVDQILAVSVNGTIAALARSYVDGDEHAFLAMVPPESFVDGANEIAIFEVMPDGDLETVSMSGL